MRCGRCGNDNAEANRFCGMCGAPLIGKPQPASQSQAVAPVVNVVPPPREPSVPAPLTSKSAPQTSQVATLKTVEAAPTDRRPAPVSSPYAEPRRAPAITGPSFLGLSNPSPASDDRPRHDSHDSFQPSSGNVDYLLEDDEEPRGGGGKFILVVVALALAVGFGYMHWKRGGFDWLNAGNKDKKAAVISPSPDSAQSAPDSAGVPAAASAPTSATPPPTTNAPVTPIPADGAATTPADSTATNATSSPGATQPGAPQQSASQTAPTPSAAAPPPAAAGTSTDAGAAQDSARPAASDSDQPSSDQAPAPPTKAAARKPAIAKPSPAKPPAAKPYDSVVEAERYIYGRGVNPDCDHGLRLLKSSAEQSNPKAMISLGALYSTGTCTPRDLPTAYRWFALALHKQPDNQALQDDLQKLWSRMTQPERQLAIKLSQ
ncbi:MAG: hypothetical protein ACYDDS_19580 [Candidatus Sulfotelmatobacter sp.]